MIFLFNQSLDLVVKPTGDLVITDYILIWNGIMENIRNDLVKEKKLLTFVPLVN